MNNEPLTTVTTVLTPAPHNPEKPCPIVSYQCAIDAMAGRCFPSYALRRHAKAVGALAQFELLLVAAVLAEGWAVSLPDHGGPKGVFGAPVEPGYCVLDGLRAALNFAPLNLSTSDPSACGDIRAAAWLPPGPPRCTPAMHQNSTSSAPCWAPPSVISETPITVSTASSSPGCPPWWWPH
jgi:hypothetical protein